MIPFRVVGTPCSSIFYSKVTDESFADESASGVLIF